MKRLEDIEKLSMLDLERIASDESVKVPDSLNHDIAVTARALEISSKEDDKSQENNVFHKRYRKILKMISYPAAAVAIITIGMGISSRIR